MARFPQMVSRTLRPWLSSEFGHWPSPAEPQPSASDFSLLTSVLRPGDKSRPHLYVRMGWGYGLVASAEDDIVRSIIPLETSLL